MVTRLARLPSAGAQNSGMRMMSPDEVPFAVGRRDPQLGVIDQHPEPAADRVDAVAGGLDREQSPSSARASRASRAARSLAWVQSSSRLYSSQVSWSGVQSSMPGGRPGDPRQPGAGGRRHPAVVVDRAAAHDLEVLGRQPARGVRVVEGVGEADAVDRVLRDAVDHPRRGDPEDLVDRRHDIVAVMELRRAASRRA